VSEGLNAIGIVERRLMRVIHTKIDYTWLGKIENELRPHPSFILKEIHYLDSVEVETYVAEEMKESFVDWMTELTNGQAEIFEGETEYLETDV
jgi:putative IMPACT (imprinted ancient) family translation regulator